MLTIVAILSILTILAILTILTIVATVTVVTSGRDWFRQIRRFSPASAVLQESKRNTISLNIKYFTFSGSSVKSIFGTTSISNDLFNNGSESVHSKI